MSKSNYYERSQTAAALVTVLQSILFRPFRLILVPYEYMPQIGGEQKQFSECNRNNIGSKQKGTEKIQNDSMHRLTVRSGITPQRDSSAKLLSMLHLLASSAYNAKLNHRLLVFGNMEIVETQKSWRWPNVVLVATVQYTMLASVTRAPWRWQTPLR